MFSSPTAVGGPILIRVSEGPHAASSPTPPKTRSPRTTEAALGGAYWAFHDKTTLRLRSNWLPWVDTEDLEAVEALAALRPSQPIAELHRQMLHDLTTENALVDEADQKAFRQRYDEAVAIALPATQAYLRHAQTINTLTRNHSLATVDLKTLKGDRRPRAQRPGVRQVRDGSRRKAWQKDQDARRDRL